MNRILRVLWFGCILAVAPLVCNTANALEICVEGWCSDADDPVHVVGTGSGCLTSSTTSFGGNCVYTCDSCLTGTTRTAYTYKPSNCTNGTTIYYSGAVMNK